MKARKLPTIFQLVDTYGLPLSMVCTQLLERGLDLERALFAFVYGARRAGWTWDKVASDLRELRIYGVVLPDSLKGLL